MVEVSDDDLAPLENEFNRLRSDVEIFRAILGAIMANAVASREQSGEFFEMIRAQVHTGLTRRFDGSRTSKKLRKFHRDSANEFFDQLAEHLEIAQTSQGRSGTN